jgi:hypothetical protein
MTTKILTVRVPRTLYSLFCEDASAIGVPVSAHVRRLLERESDADQIAILRRELLESIDNLARQGSAPVKDFEEILLLCRAIASHANPQLVSQVRAQLARTAAGR